ncbi:universal stress protein in QAH/OAS sulfhydrylase 3'region-like [Haliotis rufescens]|uniref:universal stress protein in QAH/OAS sulfhydrylase 3'region-like n=1 Tax=Haliotis rufescens TaxID=6454 RepID=UPI00201F69D5|nr:universal stress protein in QAH/OAS sulfhydrylase 3'region-like [Haliotis rufescens]
MDPPKVDPIDSHVTRRKMSTEHCSKVLIAMDGSDHSNYAFDWYMDRLHRKGNNVVVAHCPDYSAIYHTPGISGDASLIAEILREEAVKMEIIIDKLRERLTKTGVPGRILRLTGKPGSSLVKAAEEEEVDYVVTGTRGLGKVSRAILGSVSDYIVHHSHVPVFVCQKPKEESHHQV